MRAPSVRVGALLPGLLLPRFGAPAIARAGDGFAVETLETTPAAFAGRLVAQDGTAYPLLSEDAAVTMHDGLRHIRRRVRAGSAPPGGYDLVAAGAVARRAVWLRETDPDLRAAIQVAHLTDLHVDRNLRRRGYLDRVIADINQLSPDLVLVGGDVVNNGDRGGHFADASDVLAGIAAPLLVVPGNHDHGFHPRTLAGRGLGRGWRHFAAAFHPFLHFRLHLAGWDFVGFDGGPSSLSPLVGTRGLDAEALAAIARDLDDAHHERRRGVILLSHTPSRTRLTGSRPSAIRGPVAHMGRGTRVFEDLLRGAARRGQSVLHLTGHTHWIDVFQIDAASRRFVRWDHRRFAATQALRSPVALVNSQSASHSGFPFKQNSRGYGFTRLRLGDGHPQIIFHRYGGERDAT